MNTIDGMLYQQSLRRAHATAVTDPDHAVTYGELERIVGAQAAYLQSRFKPRSCILIVDDRSINGLILILASLRAELMPVLCSSAYPESYYEKMVENTRPQAFFSCKPIKGSEPIQIKPIDAVTLKCSEDSAATLIIMTSGSSGQPKGVIHTHHSLLTNHMSIACTLELNEEHRALCLPAITTSFGLSVIFSHFSRGGSVRFDPRFAYGASVAADLETHGITHIYGVSLHLDRMVQIAEENFGQFSGVRHVLHAGDRMEPWLRDKINRVFGGGVLVSMYGQTEAGPRISCSIPGDVPSAGCGRPLPDVSVRIGADRDGIRGGEIEIRSEGVMQGYWMDEDATRRAFTPDGWLRTGDSGFFDESGCLHVLGRRDDMVKIAGNRVWLDHVREVLESVPQIKKVKSIVFEENNLLVAECVATAEKTDSKTIRHHLISRLPSYAIPDIKWTNGG